MPRKLDPLTASLRRERREFRERICELEHSIADADAVLADPAATPATKGRLIAERQGWRDTLRELKDELQRLSTPRRVSKPKAAAPWQVPIAEPFRSVSVPGQHPAEPEAEPGEPILLHEFGPADDFHRRAAAVELDILLDGSPRADGEALLAEYGEAALSAFVKAYKEASDAEKRGEPWNPPAIPSPLVVQKMDAESDSESDSSDEEGSVSEPATENASTGTEQPQTSVSEAASEKDPKAKSSPEPATETECRPQNGQPAIPRGVRTVETPDGGRLMLPRPTLGTLPGPFNPDAEFEAQRWREEHERKRREAERLGLAKPLNL